MTKTPNPVPGEIEPVTPDNNRTRSDDVGPLGTGPMTDSNLDRRRKTSGPPTKRTQ